MRTEISLEFIALYLVSCGHENIHTRTWGTCRHSVANIASGSDVADLKIAIRNAEDLNFFTSKGLSRTSAKMIKRQP